MQNTSYTNKPNIQSNNYNNPMYNNMNNNMDNKMDKKKVYYSKDMLDLLKKKFESNYINENKNNTLSNNIVSETNVNLDDHDKNNDCFNVSTMNVNEVCSKCKK